MTARDFLMQLALAVAPVFAQVFADTIVGTKASASDGDVEADGFAAFVARQR